jgi:hypothetical protein
MSRIYLDRFNINPKARVIRLVGRVAVDLLLDPVNGSLILYTTISVT